MKDLALGRGRGVVVLAFVVQRVNLKLFFSVSANDDFTSPLSASLCAFSVGSIISDLAGSTSVITGGAPLQLT